MAWSGWTRHWTLSAGPKLQPPRLLHHQRAAALQVHLPRLGLLMQLNIAWGRWTWHRAPGARLRVQLPRLLRHQLEAELQVRLLCLVLFGCDSAFKQGDTAVGVERRTQAAVQVCRRAVALQERLLCLRLLALANWPGADWNGTRR
jgi:hypothetical protein